MWMRFPYPANVTLFAGLCIFFAEIVQKDFATAEVSLFGIVQHSLNPLFKIFLAFVVHGRREYDTFFFDAFTGKGDIRRFFAGDVMEDSGPAKCQQSMVNLVCGQAG